MLSLASPNMKRTGCNFIALSDWQQKLPFSREVSAGVAFDTSKYSHNKRLNVN